MYVFILEKLY